MNFLNDICNLIIYLQKPAFSSIQVAIGNLEKLKIAETALIEATMSDAEIANLTQKHEKQERQRRLSTASLPPFEIEVSVLDCFYVTS